MDEANTRFNHCEKSPSTSQLQLQKIQKSHKKLTGRYKKVTDKHQKAEHELVQLTAQITLREKRFLVQEKAQMDGTLKQLQRVSAA